MADTDEDRITKAIDREIARVERLFTKGGIFITILAGLAFAGGALSFSYINENVSKTADQAKANIEALTKNLRETTQKQIATSTEKAVSDVQSRIQVDAITSEIKTKAIDQVKEDLRKALQGQLDKVSRM